MNDVDFGTVRLKQDVGPGIYTHIRLPVPFTEPVTFTVGRTFWCLTGVHYTLAFKRSTLHQSNHKKSIQLLKAKELNSLSIHCSSILEKKNTAFWKVQEFHSHVLLVKAKGP